MVKLSRWCRALALCGATVAQLALALPTRAADEPDLIFKRSTVFKWLTPNDKLATYGLDDPEVDGVACHFTVPERGGLSGWIGVAEEVSDISLACRQVGPIHFKQKFPRGGHVSPTALAVLQEDADRARLRREAQRAGLHGLFRQADRGFAEELDVLGADHALGLECPGRKVRRLGPGLSRTLAGQEKIKDFSRTRQVFRQANDAPRWHTSADALDPAAGRRTNHVSIQKCPGRRAQPDSAGGLSRPPRVVARARTNERRLDRLRSLSHPCTPPAAGLRRADDLVVGAANHSCLDAAGGVDPAAAGQRRAADEPGALGRSPFAPLG